MSANTYYQLHSAKSDAKRICADILRTDQMIPSDDGIPRIEVTILRTGIFTDPRYGEFTVDETLLDEIIRNFNTGTYGQKIFLNVAHRPDDGAAGEFQTLYRDGGTLKGVAQLTPFGLQSIKEKGFIYASAEYWDNYVSNEDPTPKGPLLGGVALTTRPAIKHMNPVRMIFSEFGQAAIPATAEIKQFLLQEETTRMNYVALLRKKLSEIGVEQSRVDASCADLEKELAAANSAQHPDLYASALTYGFKLLAEQSQAAATAEQEKVKKQLQEMQNRIDQISQATPTNSAQPNTMANAATENAPAQITLSEGELKQFFERRFKEAQQQAEAQTKQLQEQQAAKEKRFSDALAKDQHLSAEMRTLLTPEPKVLHSMSDEAIDALAAQQLKLAEQQAAAMKMQGMGYRPAGQVHIQVSHTNEIKQLQEMVDKRQFSNMPDAVRYEKTGGQLQTVNKQFAEKALEEFDRKREQHLLQEAKLLAGGYAVVGDQAVPAVIERTIIREALHNLIGLQFAVTGIKPFSETVRVAYQSRDPQSATRDKLRVYEGQAIPRAGILEQWDEVRPLPQKLAVTISDEAMEISRANLMEHNFTDDTLVNAARIIAEDSDASIFDEILNASDRYLATAISNENVGAAFDGVKTIFPLAHFPVVQPNRILAINGSLIETKQPIAVTYNANPCTDFSLAGDTPAAAVYYLMNYNHGEISFVDETGATIAPAGGIACTIDYHHAELNTAKFNTDIDGLTTEEKWSSFLYELGKAHTLLSDKRYYPPQMQLMSATVRNEAEQAKNFQNYYQTAGTALDANGNLGRIKGIPAFNTSAPNLLMGDTRVIVGGRHVRFYMNKPWQMEPFENNHNSTGNFTGQKTTYGSQWVTVHVPIGLRQAQTSIVLYSATARVAR